MIISRSTSLILLAAVGTVLGLPVPDDNGVSLSPPTVNVQARVAANQGISIAKRMNLNVPPALEPQVSENGPPDSWSANTSKQQKRPLPSAQDVQLPPLQNHQQLADGLPPIKDLLPAINLPPAAFPPAFRWSGGRQFDLSLTYNKNPTLEELKADIEAKLDILTSPNSRFYDRKNSITTYRRINDLKKSLQEDKCWEDSMFPEKMKLMNGLLLVFNDDRYKEVENQIKWIRENINHPSLHNHFTGRRKETTLIVAMNRVQNRQPRAGDMYTLGLADDKYYGYENGNHSISLVDSDQFFSVGYLTEAYIQKEAQPVKM
ncbi:hypothetical protein F5880DRAFT_1507970 [Lentinula raphanica]|nr:hypothetical protein F5880DRAFT_1507970 [Lentinula raphanica]